MKERKKYKNKKERKEERKTEKNTKMKGKVVERKSFKVKVQFLAQRSERDKSSIERWESLWKMCCQETKTNCSLVDD